MKRFFSIIALSVSISTVFCQLPENLKIGAYKNFNNLLQNEPQYQGYFQVLLRSETSVKMFGNNDFKVESDSIKVKKSAINSNIYAVFNGDDFYFNGKFINGQKHYCLAINNQRYLIRV